MTSVRPLNIVSAMETTSQFDVIIVGAGLPGVVQSAKATCALIADDYGMKAQTTLNQKKESNGVVYPDMVWNIPVGIACFVVAIAIDTIGHRTVYKEALAEGEALIHHMTIFAGITSVVLLCLGYHHAEKIRVPALVFIFLSIVYSFFDEALHWHRYLTKKSDRIEMWSHFFILTGHLIMIYSWWKWFDAGYPGVMETLKWLPQ